MTTPGDESRTELAWREIVEHYGERAVLDDEPPGTERGARATDAGPAPAGDVLDERTADVPADRAGDLPADLPAHLEDEDEVEVRERAIAASEQFRPPPPPPLPRPRTWQRAVAWAGIAVAPLVALVVGLFSIYVPSLVGWSLVLWFVGGFVYLVREMPRSPRDPWDDGSRV